MNGFVYVFLSDRLSRSKWSYLSFAKFFLDKVFLKFRFYYCHLERKPFLFGYFANDIEHKFYVRTCPATTGSTYNDRYFRLDARRNHDFQVAFNRVAVGERLACAKIIRSRV